MPSFFRGFVLVLSWSTHPKYTTFEHYEIRTNLFFNDSRTIECSATCTDGRRTSEHTGLRLEQQTRTAWTEPNQFRTTHQG